jgi:hypothetical protein
MKTPNQALHRNEIRLAEKSEAEAISRFVSELTATHIGPTLPVEGLEHLLRGMDVESTITRMTDGFPYWVALEGGRSSELRRLNSPRTSITCSCVRTDSEAESDDAHERGATVYFR